MAYSTIPKTRRDGVITLKDGTGTPVTLAVSYEEAISALTLQKQLRL